MSTLDTRSLTILSLIQEELAAYASAQECDAALTAIEARCDLLLIATAHACGLKPSLATVAAMVLP